LSVFFGKIYTEDTIIEGTLSNKPSILGKTYLVKKEEFPKKTKLYKDLKKVGLKFIDNYVHV
jgi:hypothetical protein